MSSIRSTWATSPITIQGTLASAEWSGAGKLELWQGSSHFGTLMVKNDATYLYVALDVGKDLGNDPGTSDYFWFVIDVDRNRAVTPNGYTWIGYVETNKSLTIIKPKTTVLFKPLSRVLPFGVKMPPGS